jgi:glycosyltransferase involved in cell wall biosynthesis
MKRYNHKNIYHTVHSTFSQSALKNKQGLKLFFRKRKLQNIYNNLDIITVSNGIQDDLLYTINIKPKSIQTIYNPVDIDTINQLSNETNIIQEQNYIIHIGRFAKVKRHDILLQAYKQSNIDAKLVLVGDGEEKENIINLIDRLDLKEKVILTGFLQNPYPVLKNARLLVLSSEYEGFGNVLIEALSLNIMIISTNCKSGPNEIMEYELKQYLCNINDVENLANMINTTYLNKYFIPNNIVGKYSLKNIIAKYEELSWEK